MAVESSSHSGGIRTTNYDNSKMFLFDNNFADGQMNNSTYNDVTHPLGTIVSRDPATGLLVPLDSGASDGTQIPVGVLAADFTIEDGTTDDVRICTGGEIDSSKLVFQGSDDLDTVIDTRQLRDHLSGATVGFVLRTVDELSNFDN
jgi:hypothetical protein